MPALLPLISNRLTPVAAAGLLATATVAWLVVRPGAREPSAPAHAVAQPYRAERSAEAPRVSVRLGNTVPVRAAPVPLETTARPAPHPQPVLPTRHVLATDKPSRLPAPAADGTVPEPSDID